ncbi:MAG: MerR family transcriptional regulator [Emergencia sp.]
MRINEVEQIVGISKKNIRFYEDQGLIHPERNKANGYREYTENDIELILKIKLLRRLAVPIAEIRNLVDGRLTLPDCMERHLIYLNSQRKNIEAVSELCRSLNEQSAGLGELQVNEYLEQLDEMERGGSRFMNVSKVDVNKKKRGAKIAAVVMITIMVLWDLFFLVVNHYDPAPLPIVLLMIVPANVVIIGVILALRERIKEIEGGEENEAADY